MSGRRRFPLHVLALVAALGLAYLPDSGHGLVKDDFRWILESRVRSATDVSGAFFTDNGFYRPIVTLTFAANEALFGIQPRPYALTNWLLLLACAAALYALCRALRMEWGASLLAVGLWSLNPHGISGLVMWISGRTSALVTLFSLLAAIALAREKRLLASALCFLALMSKEEALLLPVVLIVWSGWLPTLRSWDVRQAARSSWLLLLPLLPYFALRAQTQAYLPTTAPPYYRFATDPAALARNVLEYADRSATLTAIALLLMLAAVRHRPQIEPDDRRRVLLGLVWLVGGFGLTLFLPARSSLYVCLPSVGVAIAGATIGRALWNKASPRVRSGLVVAAAVVPLALVPLLHSRNKRLRRAADLSANVLGQLQETWPRLQPGDTLVLEDDPSRRPSLREALGTHVHDAVLLATDAETEVRYLPTPDNWTEAHIRPLPSRPSARVWHFRLASSGDTILNSGVHSGDTEPGPGDAGPS